MKIRVRMLAHEKRTQNGLSVKIREVAIPNEDYNGDPEHDLPLVFIWGQNEQLPLVDRCSVSCGDVAEYGNKLWLCCSSGWKEITEEQYLELKRYDQHGLSLHPMVTGTPINDEKMGKLMHLQGYRYVMSPKDPSFAPLYVKTVSDVSRTMREDFPDHRFDLAKLNEDGSLKQYVGCIVHRESDEIRRVADELKWMTPQQVTACYPSGDLDDLAISEKRDRHDHELNVWQLATDIVFDGKKMPTQD